MEKVTRLITRRGADLPLVELNAWSLFGEVRTEPSPANPNEKQAGGTGKSDRPARLPANHRLLCSGAGVYLNSIERTEQLDLWIHDYIVHRPHSSLKLKNTRQPIRIEPGQPLEPPNLRLRQVARAQ